MAIAPPSDIVLDVAQAADPLKLQAATSKLARLAAGGGASVEDFDTHLKTSNPSPAPSNTFAGTTRAFAAPATQTRPGSPYQKFEAMVLQTFVQNILPKDESLFGDAASADVCRSLLAEQLAAQLAKGGRLGIAKMIEAAHPHHPASAELSSPASVRTDSRSDPSIQSARAAALEGVLQQRTGSNPSLDPLGAELATESSRSAPSPARKEAS